MKRAAVILAMWAAVATAAGPVTLMLDQQMRLQQRLLEEEANELGRQLERVEEAWVRVRRESSDLSRAQRQGESLESLRLRDADLRQAESDLVMQLEEAQRLRRAVLGRKAEIVLLQARLEELEGRLGPVEDPITGMWNLRVEPGGMEGLATLQLNGTLVQGTYSLSGGWSGSLRGTLVADKVRLERIDAQIGFAAIFFGVLVERGEVMRLEGRWESTQLASGLPSAGSWVAERLEEVPE